MISDLAKSKSPVAQYVEQIHARRLHVGRNLLRKLGSIRASSPRNNFYTWTSRWIEDRVTETRLYGRPAASPDWGEQQVHIIDEIDNAKLDRLFMDLLTRPTPSASIEVALARRFHSRSGGRHRLESKRARGGSRESCGAISTAFLYAAVARGKSLRCW